MKPAAVVLLAAAAASCGYRISGRADLLPKTVSTIAVPAWENQTARYQLAGMLPAAIAREFVSRTRYRIVADPGQADAILSGSIISYRADPTVFDPATSRAAAAQATVVLQVRLTERSTGAVLFDRPSFEARTRYEISTDPAAFFDESGAAMERLSREVARGLVSAILERF